jgi:hypothetical protein
MLLTNSYRNETSSLTKVNPYFPYWSFFQCVVAMESTSYVENKRELLVLGIFFVEQE